MGCELSKTATVVPASAVGDEEHPLNHVQRTISAKIIRQTPSPQSNVDISPSNGSIPVTPFDQTVARAPTTWTIISNGHPQINSTKSSSTFNERDARSTSSDSKRVLARPKAARALGIQSYRSESTESVFPNNSPVDWHGTYSAYGDLVSSSASTNTEKTLFRQDTISRFTSARVETFQTNRDTEINDFASDSDDSYPLYRSFVTSSSSSSGRSVTSGKSDRRSSEGHESKTKMGRHVTTNETQFSLELPSCTSSERNKRTTYPKPVIQSESPKRTKSDTYSHTIVYETSYESDTDLQQ